MGLSGPLVASVGMAYVLGGKSEVWGLLKRTFPARISLGWFVLALALPPALMLGAAWFCRESLHEHPALFDSSLVGLVPMFIWLLFRSGPVNEEFGWRGFLLPRLLQKANPFAATTVLGVIWTAWHWPLWFLSGVPHQHWPFPLFALMVLAMNFLFTWFFMKTKGSLLIAILLHGSVNAAIKFIPILPPNYSSLDPFIIWVCVAWALVAVIVACEWRAWLGRSAVSASGVPIGAPAAIKSL
jgi:membrane protease YdiL (CAAX protease family)